MVGVVDDVTGTGAQLRGAGDRMGVVVTEAQRELQMRVVVEVLAREEQDEVLEEQLVKAVDLAGVERTAQIGPLDDGTQGAGSGANGEAGVRHAARVSENCMMAAFRTMGDTMSFQPTSEKLMPDLSPREEIVLLARTLWREGYNDHLAGHITVNLGDGTLLCNPWHLLVERVPGA